MLNNFNRNNDKILLLFIIMWNISKFLNNASRNIGGFINSSADFVGKMTNKVNNALTQASNFFDNYIVPASKATVIATEYMKNSKERGEVDIGWQTCLDKYLCGIDSLRAI